MFSMGIDIGSTTSKCVVMNGKEEIVAKALIKAGTGTDGPVRAVQTMFEGAGLSFDDIDKVIATGYGRLRYEHADDQISELSAHAIGTHYLMPEVRTVIDIGGQDVKVLTLSEKGKLLNFLMNDKCAAGTGRFLDVMAAILQMNVSELGECALKAEKPSHISSTCTVFAESEVISQLSSGIDRDEIVAGICESVASKTAALAKRTAIRPEVAISGGVANNKGVVYYLEKNLGVSIRHHELAQYTGAVGAALYGLTH